MWLFCVLPQVECFLGSSLALFGDNWPSLLSPKRCVQLLQGLTALQATPPDLMVKVSECETMIAGR
jgi:hypothetical protein